ncbi:MAG: DUF3365 domain-containing protein [Sulfuricaulis sp.]|uniref:Tll0287-like domain-containing protein n=1 Tax=Sulfuricaulis sp. TaxID=2003553 RepID=UPI0025EDF20C|nr:DUF3365 domain-containing protein [Sulfuricaulis sp.]MCR4347359.1 DUF3365 domain-containing protein [Sulfuricaulis sp.]
MKLNRLVATAILVGASTMSLPVVAGDAPPVDDVKAVAGNYAKQLKSALLEAMTKEGPEKAMSVCSEKAVQIGNETARQTGWSLRRVTTKARNPLNMPDAYETAVLGDFEKILASGKEDAARYEVVTESGVRYARFTKALKIEPLCLTCHGVNEAVAPGVRDRLAKLYPHDRARGYQLNELRGALSIKIRLD